MSIFALKSIKHVKFLRMLSAQSWELQWHGTWPEPNIKGTGQRGIQWRHVCSCNLKYRSNLNRYFCAIQYYIAMSGITYGLNVKLVFKFVCWKISEKLVFNTARKYRNLGFSLLPEFIFSQWSYDFQKAVFYCCLNL